jgi:hypothetical protein
VTASHVAKGWSFNGRGTACPAAARAAAAGE